MKPSILSMKSAKLEAFAGILSEGNRELLRIINDSQPESMTELAELSGRKASSLSRTLKSMAHYGLIDLQKDSKGRIRPKVNYRVAWRCALTPENPKNPTTIRLFSPLFLVVSNALRRAIFRSCII